MNNNRRIRTTVLCLAGTALLIYLAFVAAGVFGQ